MRYPNAAQTSIVLTSRLFSDAYTCVWSALKLAWNPAALRVSKISLLLMVRSFRVPRWGGFVFVCECSIADSIYNVKRFLDEFSKLVKYTFFGVCHFWGLDLYSYVVYTKKQAAKQHRNEVIMTHITVRVSPDDKAQMERVAESYGMNVSEFLRTMTDWVERNQPRLIIEPKPVNRDKEPA